MNDEELKRQQEQIQILQAAHAERPRMTRVQLRQIEQQKAHARFQKFFDFKHFRNQIIKMQENLRKEMEMGHESLNSQINFTSQPQSNIAASQTSSSSNSGNTSSSNNSSANNSTSSNSSNIQEQSLNNNENIQHMTRRAYRMEHPQPVSQFTRSGLYRRQQNQINMASSQMQEPFHLRSFFKNLIHDPKETLNDIGLRTARGIGYALSVVNEPIDEIKAKGTNIISRGLDRASEFMQEHKQNSIELGHPNVQGLEVVRDKQNPRGYRFKATRRISIDTGNKNPDGSKIYMHMEPGDVSGMIIPEGRKNKQALAQYSHGQRYVKLALDKDSTLTMDKSLKNPDVFGRSMGYVHNSDLKLSGNGYLGPNNTIDNVKHAEFGNKISNSYLKDSQNLAFFGQVYATGVTNCNGIMSQGEINSSSFEQSQFRNTGKKAINNSFVIASDVRLTDKKSGLDHAQIHQATVINSSITNNSFLEHGLYQNSDIDNSKLLMSDNSRLNDAVVDNTRIMHQDPYISYSNFDDVMLDGDTIVAGSTSKHQNMKSAILTNTIATGDINFDHAELTGSKDHPNVIRNMGAKDLVAKLDKKPAALTDVFVDSRHDRLKINDNNLNSSTGITGENLASYNKLVQDVQNGNINPQKIESGMSEIRQPQQAVNIQKRQLFTVHDENEKSIKPEEHHNRREQTLDNPGIFGDGIDF